MATFGEVSYNDDAFGDKKNNNKDLFARLDDTGDNEFRILTNPFQYLVHKVKKDPTDKKDYGTKVYCSATPDCPVCMENDKDSKVKTRWLYGVISRKTGKYQILDVGYATFSQIKKLAKNTARWGDPTKYDINIVVDKQGGPTGYYSVQPISKEPLSAADQQIKDNVDFDDLKRRITPPTVDAVKLRLSKIFGDTPPQVRPPQQTAPAAHEDEEENPDFPEYGSQS